MIFTCYFGGCIGNEGVGLLDQKFLKYKEDGSYGERCSDCKAGYRVIALQH